MKEFNHIKAYLLGLLVGSGRVDDKTFILDLPFKKWGAEPKRMGVIATDILTKIQSYFHSTYNFNITYEIGNSRWLIMPIENADISQLKSDLEYLGLPKSGFLLNNADLIIAKSKLNGINVESFLSGIFDTRASLTKSHRRFTDSAPVVSLEIPGSTENFNFIVQLSDWLLEMGANIDQILFNHPNQQSASDPYYKSWKKGFKIRFLARSFLAKYSFALQAKSIDAKQLEKNQKIEEQNPWLSREISMPSPVSVHSEQNSMDLPIEVRNKLFFHYLHFCAVLGSKFAPIDEIKRLIHNKEKLINFFPRLSKGDLLGLKTRFKELQSVYFPDLPIKKQILTVKDLITQKDFQGFSDLEQGLAYLFSKELNGKRHKGSKDLIIRQSFLESLLIFTIGDTFDSPLLILNEKNKRAFITSAVSNSLNQQLIKENIIVDGLIIKIKEQ